jgi:hypothetical protein
MSAPWRRPADSQSSWTGTRRYGFRPAPPGGLALVQDFLNTREHGEKGPDLLGNAEQANAWAANAIQKWSALRSMRSPKLTLTDDDAARLRELRDLLDMVVTERAVERRQHDLGTAAVTMNVDGEMSWMPTGRGWCWLRSAIMGEVVMSQETGTWRRMKQCRNPLCQGTFYDSSWNNRGICRHPSPTSVTAVADGQRSSHAGLQ